MDRELAALAAWQHGRVALWQMGQLGLGRSAIAGRVASGRLHRTGRGVYAVGHMVDTRESVSMSAVLECGPGAVLSHRSCADHLGLRPCSRTRVDVTALGRRGRYLPDVDDHSSRMLDSADVTKVRAIPCTTPARTLLDLAEVLDRRGLERAVEQAERLRVFDGRALERLLARANGRRAAGTLRQIVRAYDEPAQTQGELERRFLELCRCAGIERPQTQVPLELAGGDPVLADFVWPRAGLVVETDGRETHGTRHAFERDRSRDRGLMLLGWRVARFTWLDLLRRPDDVARTISALLGPLRGPRPRQTPE